jgi:cytochrome c5
MKTKFLIVVIFVFAAMVLAACGGNAKSTPHPGEALVAAKCGECHGMALVDKAKYSRDDWQKTVDRMVLSGMKVTDEELASIVDYLAIRDSK